MPDPNPAMSAAEMIASLVQAGPDWPPEFTDADKEIVACLDNFFTRVNERYIAIVLAERQQLISALLARRNGLQ